MVTHLPIVNTKNIPIFIFIWHFVTTSQTTTFFSVDSCHVIDLFPDLWIMLNNQQLTGILHYITSLLHITYILIISLSDRRSKYNEQIPMIHFILLLSIVLIIIINPDQSLVMLYDALEGAISELPLLKNKLEMIRKLAILFEGTS